MSEHTNEVGPIYGSLIPIEPIPIGAGMKQAMASRRDLKSVLDANIVGGLRVVSAYEVIAARLAESQAEEVRLVICQPTINQEGMDIVKNVYVYEDGTVESDNPNNGKRIFTAFQIGVEKGGAR